MLRVITRQVGDRYRIELHGMLGGEWVRLLDEHWRAILADLPSATVTVVLSDVEFIDPEGEGLLQRMVDGGVVFVASGCMNRYVIEKMHPVLQRPDVPHGVVGRAAGSGASEED